MYTLGEFIIKNQDGFSHSKEALLRLFSSIKLAAKSVYKEVNKAGLTKNLGSTGVTNIQGENQQKLDSFAHQAFIESFQSRNVVCGIASEESKNFLSIKKRNKDSSKLNDQYIVLIDPLDGSSNIDVNVPIGTIFSVYKKKSSIEKLTIKDFLQKGINQIIAGYIIYGSSTILVYSVGKGVHGFTLDPSLGTFYLSHPNIRFSNNNRIYSINDGNYAKFSNGIKKFIKFCQKESNQPPYTARYIGSLVGDFHRNMISGGIYVYPKTKYYPEGKLRLLYECNPIAFLTEQAGGKASNGIQRILDIKPIDLHQRSPFICGSYEMVSKLEKFIKKYD